MNNPIIFDNKDAWLKAKTGKFSASQIYRLLTDPKKTSDKISQGALTYVYEVAAELLTEQAKFVPLNNAMERGLEHEPYAFAQFCKTLGFDVTSPEIMHFGVSEYGLYSFGNYLCASPDGVVNECVFEIKCPDSATHLKYRQLKTADDLLKMCPDYYYQMQLNMLLGEIKRGYFVSYDDRYKEDKQLYAVEILASPEAHDKILSKLEIAIEYLLPLIN